MRRVSVFGTAVLVARCVFPQDVFAQRSGSREFVKDNNRAAAPGYIGQPRTRVVVRPALRWSGHPRLVYYRILISPTWHLALRHSFLQVMPD